MSKRTFSETSETFASPTCSDVSPSSSRQMARSHVRGRPYMIDRPSYAGRPMPMSARSRPAYQPDFDETTDYHGHFEASHARHNVSDRYHITDGDLRYGDGSEDFDPQTYNSQECTAGESVSDGYHVDDDDNSYEDGSEGSNSQSYDNQESSASNMKEMSNSDAGTQISPNPEPRKDGSRRPPIFTAHTYSLGMQPPGYESGETPRMAEKKRLRLYERRGSNGFQESEAGESVRDVGLAHSRTSGALPDDDHLSPLGTTERRSTNKLPELVDAESLPDSYFYKNNMKRPPSGSGIKLPKRTCGANDPENIQIVNLREQKDWSFKLIKNHLNARRVKNGLNPSHTDTSVANRYNRTAPLLFAASGQEFVPLSERKKGWQDAQLHWTDQMNATLVAAVKLVDGMKWIEVSRLFSSKHGIEIDPMTLARKHASYMK